MERQEKTNCLINERLDLGEGLVDGDPPRIERGCHGICDAVKGGGSKRGRGHEVKTESPNGKKSTTKNGDTWTHWETRRRRREKAEPRALQKGFSGKVRH